MKLMIENVDKDSLKVVSESVEGSGKTWKISGPFMGAESKNRNGRIYRLPVLTREVNKFIEEKINQNRAVGELDHPPTPQINLDRVSHKITDLRIEGNDVIGTATILNTPTGKIVQALLEGGVSLGVSTRGLGDLESDGIHVSDNYNLLTVDIVGDPSNQKSIVEGIYESKEYIMDGDEIVEVAINNFKKKLDQNGSRHLLEDLKSFLKEIAKGE